MYDFIVELAPHLTREIVQEALSRPNASERYELYSHIELPTY
jgi:LysR family cys regulon transcriptional activator